MKHILYTMCAAIMAISGAQAQTIADLLDGQANFSRLNTAATAAGLTELLQGPGPYTVFAARNAAFNNLMPNLENAFLTDPEGVLKDIIEYHILEGEFNAVDLVPGQQYTTILGQTVTISTSGANTFVNQALIETTNIQASNGVVHVVGTLLAPQTTTMFDIVEASPDHTILETALIASGLDVPLQGPPSFPLNASTYTLFAPTDAAFNALPPGVLDALLADPTGALAEVLQRHVANGVTLAGNLSNGQSIQTLNGETALVTINNDGVFINNAEVIVTNLVGINGVVHVVDAVIENNNLPTIFEIVANSEIHNTLETALLASSLDGTLGSPGSFTLFAPTDAAFEALPDGVLDALLADPFGSLTDVLLQHVANSVILSDNLSDGQEIPTLSGVGLEINFVGGAVYINDAQIIVADIFASNGVVHVIDAVLTDSTLPTIFEIVANSEVHTTLETALLAAGLDATLSSEGDFTLFAPTDDAFAALPEGVLDALLADPFGSLTDVLLQHVTAASVLSNELADGQEILSLAGETLVVNFVGGAVFINNAQVIIADIPASNGVVHVIDAVLGNQPLPTIFDIVAESEVHTTLEAALVAAELDGTLSGEGDFTLFAPTDEAFAALPEGALDELLADPSGLLTTVLLTHVAGSSVLSSALSDGQEITTLSGEIVTISIADGNVFVNGAQVIIADIPASNGVVHVIDAVLGVAALPTIFQIVADSDVHNTLETALFAAGLDGTLDGEGDFTLFAPTDAAFAALPAGVLDELLADPSGLLTTVLLSHVAGSSVFSADLSNGQEITTLSGAIVVISITGSDVFVNDAQVTIADIEASNGVVHVINAVLTDVLSASEVQNRSAFNIFPNPATQYTEIDLSGNGDIFNRGYIVDLQGRTVLDFSSRLPEFAGNTMRLELSGLPNGAYIINLLSATSLSTAKLQVLR